MHRIPNEQDPDHFAAIETRPHVPSEDNLAMAGAITKRRTDRRRFMSWDVPAAHLDLLVRRAAKAGALLVPVTGRATRWLLTHAIDITARQLPDNPDYQLELVTWSGRSFATQDGVLTATGPPTAIWHDDTAMRAFPGGTLGNAPHRPGRAKTARNCSYSPSCATTRCQCCGPAPRSSRPPTSAWARCSTATPTSS